MEAEQVSSLSLRDGEPTIEQGPFPFQLAENLGNDRLNEWTQLLGTNLQLRHGHIPLHEPGNGFNAVSDHSPGYPFRVKVTVMWRADSWNWRSGYP